MGKRRQQSWSRMGRVQVPWCYQICSLHKLFGNTINFYGGIGECNHKKFVKETGCNTQKRIPTFTSQVAWRYYEGMTLDIARKAIDFWIIITENDHVLSHQEYNEEKSITIIGWYKLTFVDLDDLGQFRDHYVSGRENKTLPIKFICGLSLFCLTTLNLHGKTRSPAIRHVRWFLNKGQSYFTLHWTLEMTDHGTIGV